MIWKIIINNNYNLNNILQRISNTYDCFLRAISAKLKIQFFVKNHYTCKFLMGTHIPISCTNLHNNYVLKPKMFDWVTKKK